MNITTGKSVYLQVCYCCLGRVESSLTYTFDINITGNTGIAGVFQLGFTLQFSNYKCWELSGIKKEKRADLKN